MNGLHAIPLHRHSRAASASARAPVKLRLKVYATRGALGRQIASGRPFLFTLALALRAQQLAEPRTRRRIARAQVLITDGLSPLFHRNSPRTVTQAIYEVQDALEDELPDVFRDAAAL